MIIPSIILWCTQLKTASLRLLQGQLVRLRKNLGSFAELACGCSPAAFWAILQLDTQLKPQADHHQLNPVLLSAGWESKHQPCLWQHQYSLDCKRCPRQTLLSNKMELLVNFRGVAYFSCTSTLRIPGQDIPSSQCSQQGTC